MGSGIAPPGYFEDGPYAGRSWRFYGGLLAQVVSLSEPGLLVDAGSGSGLFLEAASRWGLDCVGLEGSSAAIELALARFEGLRILMARLEERWPLNESSASTVVMNQVIEHLDIEGGVASVTEAARVLRPGGVLVVNSPCVYNKAESLADPTHLHCYAPSELRDLLRAAGFEGVRSVDSARPFLGHTRFGVLAASGVLKLRSYDRLSATANCIAYKPRSS